MSKCHIGGNHMTGLNYDIFLSLCCRREGDIDFLNTLVKEINDEVRAVSNENKISLF